MNTKKISHIEVELEIENQSFTFEVVGEYTPETGDGVEDERREESFDVHHLYHTDTHGECKDWVSLMDWPHIEQSVIDQLKETTEEL